MNREALRTTVALLTIVTALVHLVILNLGLYQDEGHIDLLFTLNGLGYFALLGAFLERFKFLNGKEALVHYGFIAYALATIAAFFIFDGGGFVGYFTKTVEVLLIIAIWLHLKRE